LNDRIKAQQIVYAYRAALETRDVRIAELERYAALGQACEANGLAWYIEDGTMRFQPPADLIEEQCLARALKAEARLAEAVGALEPFAKIGAAFSPSVRDEATASFDLTAGDFRRARQALSSVGEGQ